MAQKEDWDQKASQISIFDRYFQEEEVKKKDQLINYCFMKDIGEC